MGGPLQGGPVDRTTISDNGVDPLLSSFQLTAASTLIDVGTCGGAPPVDVDGDPRPSGADCDIGADEFVP